MAESKAALSGDLIGSRKLGAKATDASIEALDKATRQLEEFHNTDMRFTRSRGDGWQLLIERPGLVLATCLTLTARLRAAETGLETRIAIGIGQVDSTGSTDLADASGSAFEIAGDLLDQMTRPASERWMIDGRGVSDWPRAVLALASAMAQDWTAPQAEAVAMTISHPDLHTNEARAEKLGISRQAFEARLKGSGISHLYYSHQAFIAHSFDKDYAS